jgi:tRNA1(Val) A37 N6-methylase TrmN6
MAHEAVRLARKAHDGPVRSGVDPACGTGAFLVALADLGVPEIAGVELDEAAIAVAQVAVPGAQIYQGDGLVHGPSADLVVGNPPYVPPERQDKAQRAALRKRFPWLHGRFDLSVPFAAAAVERAAPGGVVALVLPAPLMVQPYGAALRRRWVGSHRIHAISPPTHFPGASVLVVTVVLTVGAGPAPLPDHGLPAAELLSLAQAPLNPALMPGDPALVARIRSCSVMLGSLAEVDTGVVSHGPGGGKARLLSDEPRPGLVPYVDARDLAHGRTRWLDYQPDQMHRPKRPELFASPKVLVQRLRGRGPVHAWVDHSGLYAGHTLTVVRPHALMPELMHSILTHPLTDAILRIERGQRLDLYPRDVREMPVPEAWLEDPSIPLERAWNLSAADVARLHRHL